jgi:hydroxymethylbilane synthase
VFPENGTLRLGTRGSALALRQTERVVELLHSHYPDLTCSVQVVSTQGDRDKHTSLQVLGGQGIFAKELQNALTSQEIDLAVHSVKDLTSELPVGLMLAAIPEREDPRDVIVGNRGSLSELPPGSTIGTSSRRRIALVKRLRPDIEITDLRGNIDTRIRRATEGPLDAAVLAAAGIQRMGWQDRIRDYLDISEFVPAPGQGALGIEIRADNHELRELLEPLNDAGIARAIASERSFLRAVGGGCTSPIGAYASIVNGSATFTGMLATEDLGQMCIERIECSADQLESAARDMAARMLTELGLEVRPRV